jgi:DNA polymerase III epsilon subunit family exonuclease
MGGERYAVVDVETTGFSPVNDRIVEVACVVVDGEKIVDRWSSLVNPGIAIPAYATAIHAITDDMVEGAPAIKPVLKLLRSYSEGRAVVAHCARFDAAFLGPSCVESAICTMLLARVLVPEAPNHKNQTLRTFLRIDRIARERLRAHRALADAIVTAHILIECRRRFRDRYAGQSWMRFVRRNAIVRPSAGRAAWRR